MNRNEMLANSRKAICKSISELQYMGTAKGDPIYWSLRSHLLQIRYVINPSQEEIVLILSESLSCIHDTHINNVKDIMEGLMIKIFKDLF